MRNAAERALVERHQAARAYRETGSLRKAAQQCGIPWQTIAAWKARHPEWWNAALDPESARASLASIQAEANALIASINDRRDDGRHVFPEEYQRLRELHERIRAISAALD